MPKIEFDKELLSTSLPATERLARDFFDLIAGGGVVALYGELGAGKTTFVRGVARAAGIDPENVNSPSFAIINEYHGGAMPIYHFDLYRLKNPAEFLSTGGEEYFGQPGVVMIEWAENGGEYIPDDRFEVTLRIIDDHTRGFIFSKRSK